MLVEVSKHQQLQLWQENHYKRVTLWLKHILLLQSGCLFLVFLIRCILVKIKKKKFSFLFLSPYRRCCKDLFHMVRLNLESIFPPKPCYDTLLEDYNYDDHWYLGSEVYFLLLSAKGIHSLLMNTRDVPMLNPVSGTVWLTEVHGAAAHPGITIPGFFITCTYFRGPVLPCIHFLFGT